MLADMNVAASIDGAMFVHGGHHDKSCWQLLLPLMELPSIAVDLPGRGARPSNGEAITYTMCAEAVLADADAAGFDRFPLVGHSMGGLTISRTALEAPERVAHLVYVGALVPPVGVTVAEVFGRQRAQIGDLEMIGGDVVLRITPRCARWSAIARPYWPSCTA